MGFVTGSPRRRGVGSIIGAAFILLILMTGFSYYSLQFSETRKYSTVLQEMQEFDLRRNSESVEVLSVSTTDSDKLNITVLNTGSYQAHFIWLGVHDEISNSHEYYDVDIYIEPGETVTDIGSGDVDLLEGEERELQLISEWGNIFACSYPQRISDVGNYTQAHTEIRGMGAAYNPTDWNLLGSTTDVGGSAADLVDDDGSYAVFRSYFTGVSNYTVDYVDSDSSDVDGSPDRGTHSDFTSEQAGPDSVYDTLTESGGSSETRYMTSIQHAVNGLTAYNLSLAQTSSFMERSTQRNGGKSCTWGIRVWKRALDGTETEITSGTKVATVLRDVDGEGLQFATWNCPGSSLLPTDALVVRVYVDLESGDVFLEEYITEQLGESELGEDVWTVYYWTRRARGGGRTTAYFRFGDVAHNSRVWISGNFRLDLEVQWTGVDYDEAVEQLCVYGGNMGAEDILVDAWFNGSWHNLLTDLASGWNNVSVSTYLDSSTFTVRFMDGVVATDGNQDSWNIDAALLKVGNDTSEYTSEVEFVCFSNLEQWTTLDWVIDSSWDAGSVNVTIQFFDFALGDYVISGDGYYNYISDVTPSTDEMVLQTINDAATNNFKNGTGHWRVKMRGAKPTGAQFLMSVDQVKFKPTCSSAGRVIAYDTWQEYEIESTTAEGDPLSFAYLSIYGNGTSLTFRDFITKAPLSNPGWVYLDVDGKYYLELNSASMTQEDFVLKAVVGNVAGELRVTQESP